jgi:ABC-type molybdate transport system substrate-binding protein
MDVGGSAHDDRRYYDARGDNLMTSRQYLVSFLLFGFLSFAIQGQGYADELKIFASRAVATVLEKITPEFEKGTVHKLNSRPV